MGNARLNLNLSGFEKMLANLDLASKDIDRAADSAIKESAKAVETELRSEAAAKGVPPDIIQEIKVSTKHEADAYSAKVGWELGSYDPRKPSAGYKAIFLNFGTVRRQTQAGQNRGEIPKRSQDQQFIYSAKKKARTKVRKVQKGVLEKIMRDLDK